MGAVVTATELARVALRALRWAEENVIETEGWEVDDEEQKEAA